MGKASQSPLRKLEQIVARDPLAAEVEDVLAVLRATEPDAAARLRSLSLASRWLPLEDAQHGRDVPLATWADLVALSLDGGPGAVQAIAIDGGALDRRRAMAIGVLEAVGAPGGLSALVRCVEVARTRLPLDLEFAMDCARALNEVLRGATLDSGNEATARTFLHELHSFTAGDEERATIILALRWVGDPSSEMLLAQHPELAPPWQDVVKTARKELRRRLRASA
jgi:hypothetical protein